TPTTDSGHQLVSDGAAGDQGRSPCPVGVLIFTDLGDRRCLPAALYSRAEFAAREPDGNVVTDCHLCGVTHDPTRGVAGDRIPPTQDHDRAALTQGQFRVSQAVPALDQVPPEFRLKFPAALLELRALQTQ